MRAAEVTSPYLVSSSPTEVLLPTNVEEPPDDVSDVGSTGGELVKSDGGNAAPLASFVQQPSAPIFGGWNHKLRDRFLAGSKNGEGPLNVHFAKKVEKSYGLLESDQFKYQEASIRQTIRSVDPSLSTMKAASSHSHQNVWSVGRSASSSLSNHNSSHLPSFPDSSSSFAPSNLHFPPPPQSALSDSAVAMSPVNSHTEPISAQKGPPNSNHNGQMWIQQMDVVAQSAYRKAWRDLQMQHFALSAFRAPPPTQPPPPIIIHNTTNTKAVAESAAQPSDGPSKSDAPPLSFGAQFLRSWDRFWSSYLNRCFVLCFGGMMFYVYIEWRTHRHRVDLWRRRVESSPVLWASNRLTRMFRALSTPNEHHTASLY